MATASEPSPSELRLKIGRMRRRINGRIRSVDASARRLVSWRAMVARYPGHAAIAAFGGGLALSAGLRRGRLVRWLGSLLVSRSLDQALGLFWQEVRRRWSPAASDCKDTAPRGTEP